MTTHLDHRERPAVETPRSSVVVGSLWMVGISLILFFLPLINGLVGGTVGGYKVGSVGRALAAAVLPAIVVALVLWGIVSLFGAPGWGILAGATGGLLIALADVGIFIGALIGGALGRRRVVA